MCSNETGLSRAGLVQTAWFLTDYTLFNDVLPTADVIYIER
jgi:hypothetical protein